MFVDYYWRKSSQLKAWWRIPATAKDRVFGIFVGAWGTFWIGVFAFLAFGPSSASFGFLGMWAASSIVLGILMGALFPKTTTIALFPFIFFGGGPGS